MPKKSHPKKTRRVQGTGAIFFSEALQKHVGRVIVGRKENGSPKYTQRSARTVAELQKKLDAISPAATAGGVTVAAWLARWLSEMRCKPGTRRNRMSLVAHHIGPSLGAFPVRSLTPRQIEVAASHWPLQPTSARHALSTLGTAMRAAVRAELRPDNPVRSAQKPKGGKKKIDPFTLAEVAAIAADAARRPNTRAIAVLAATGMRAGECLALDCPDFDPRAETLAVTKTLDNTDRHLSGTPKSENGVRTIRVPDAPAAALAALRAAIGARKTGPVFRTATAKRTIYKVLYATWQVLLKRLGIRYRGMHQLRHAWASHALDAGAPASEVAKYLGDTVETVIKTYAHATARVDAAAVFAGLFKGAGGDRKVTAEPAEPPNAKESRRKSRK